MTLSRRHVLAGFALVSAASCAGVGAVAASWWKQDALAPLVLLSTEEVSIFDAIAEAAYPEGGDPPIGGRRAGVGRWLDAVLRAMPEEQSALLRLGLHALDASTLVTHGARFRALDTPTATDALRGWLTSDLAELRGVAQSLTIFVGMGWFSHPEVAPLVARHSTCGLGR